MDSKDTTDTRVYSQFTAPASQTSNSETSFCIMSKTSPIISSALHRSFPMLLMLDNFLSFLTWTNDDFYYNFLCICGVVSVVLNWLFCVRYLVPIGFAFVFSCFGWSIQSIMKDTSSSSDETVPTLQEILDTLENISTRFAILISPVSTSFAHLKSREILRLLSCTLWITPIQIILVKYVFAIEKIVAVALVIALTFNSPWAIATRKLLWRSIYVRKIAYLVTGLEFNVRNESYDQKSFKILSHNKLSLGQNGKIIQFEILENQRRWIAIGWSDYLLPYERTNFTTVSLTECPSPQDFEFTVLHTSHSWKWLENGWAIDFEFNKNKDGSGWVYYDGNWKYPTYYDGMTKYTRTRKWKRKALLIVDNPL